MVVVEIVPVIRLGDQLHCNWNSNSGILLFKVIGIGENIIGIFNDIGIWCVIGIHIMYLTPIQLHHVTSCNKLFAINNH